MIVRLLPLSAFLFLGTSPFWIDEVFTVYVSRLPVGEIAQQSRSLGGEVSPPLYYLFLHFWLKLGSSEAWARLPSALAAAATAWVVGAYASRHGGRIASVVSILLICTSTLWLKHAQEARMYGFVMLFSTVSILCLRSLLTSGTIRKRIWLVWTVSNLLLCSVSFAGLYVVALSGAALAFGLHRKPRRLALGASLLALSLLPTLPILTAFWEKVIITQPYFRVNPGVLGNVVFLYVKKVLFPMSPISPPWRDWTVWSQIAADLGFLVLLGIGLSAAWRRRRADALFWSLWILSPLPVAAWASTKGWMFEDRVITYMIPIAHLLAGIGGQAIQDRFGLRTAWIAGIVCVSLNLPAVAKYFAEPRKEWRRVTDTVAREMKEEDALMATGVSAYPLSYYLGIHSPPVRPSRSYLLPGHGNAEPCDLYSFRSPGRLLILDGFIVPCRLPFSDAAATPLLSSSDLNDVLKNHPRIWVVIESGNQGIPFWREPWRSVLDDVRAKSTRALKFGGGEGVLLLETARIDSTPLSIPFDTPIALWPGGTLRVRFRTPEPGRYSIELIPLASPPRPNRLLLGKRYSEANRTTPLEVVLMVDGHVVQSLTFQADGHSLPPVPVQLHAGEHLFQLSLPSATEQLLLNQQRSLPIGRLRIKTESTVPQSDNTIR